MKYPKTLFNVTLVEPEIPNNTGNIGRTCVGSWSHLHLVGKLGFDISDKQVRRSGLDYWPSLDFTQHQNWDSFFESIPDKKRVFFFTTKTDQPFYDIEYKPGDYFVFGKETKGLPEALLKQYPEQCVTVPFPGEVRSFNLANTVAMALSEGLRQLSKAGELPRH